jgi:hypothetical protein
VEHLDLTTDFFAKAGYTLCELLSKAQVSSMRNRVHQYQTKIIMKAASEAVISRTKDYGKLTEGMSQKCYPWHTFAVFSFFK